MADGMNWFSPRPEAHAMEWHGLLPPVQRAVSDLLVRIGGAANPVPRPPDLNGEIQRILREGSETANCFLVYGTRGSGKTSVLLSARKAIRDPATYFRSESNEPNNKLHWHKAAETSAECLKKSGAVWLDILDLEPLQADANLLTAMLTRLRDAAGTPGEPGQASVTSILEQGANSAHQQLSRLINESALVWGDIQEPDTRTRAHREVASAEIHARFRKDFLDAMAALSYERARRAGAMDQCYPIILPIDNIDRSTDHLASIMKLGQMVYCPIFWIVMAGDRQDVDTFLERAFWKELISVGNAAGAIEKPGLGGEDEAFVMARRQAAAASHRVLPPSHRVEVRLVKADETLNYAPPTKNGEPRPTIRKFMEDIDLNLKRDNDEWIGPSPMKLIGLFEMQDGGGEYERSGQMTEDKRLTNAARLALDLPARGVVDLWNLLNWVKNEYGYFTEGVASKVARIMVKNIVAESTISSKMGRYLIDANIRRQGELTILDFTEPNPVLDVDRLTTPEFEYFFDRISDCTRPDDTVADEKRFSFAVSSTVTAYEPAGVVLSLTGLNEELKHNGYHAHGAGVAAEETGRGVEKTCSKEVRTSADSDLPDPVAGWLMILYDSLIWSALSDVRYERPLDTYLVKTAHESVFKGDRYGFRGELKHLFWPAPAWSTFLAHDIFEARWTSIRKELGKIYSLPCCTGDDLLRFMAAGWIHCVLFTFLITVSRRDQRHVEDIKRCLKEQEKIVQEFSSIHDKHSLHEKHETSGRWVNYIEEKVIRSACDVYEWITKTNLSNKESEKTHKRVFFDEEGYTQIKKWLDRKMPLLMSYVYVPLDECTAHKSRKENIEKIQQEKWRLFETWRRQLPFILAEIDQTIAPLFCPSEQRAAANEKLPVGCLDHWLPPVIFENLRELLERRAPPPR